MNWDALGATAELISALGVIITLIYLAIQIRANTKESQLSSINDLSNQYTSFLAHITSSEELSTLYVKAITGDPKTLSPTEHGRALMLYGMILRILENAHQQHLAKRMDTVSWLGYKKLIDRGVYSNFFSEYWKLRKDMHNSSFQNLVEKTLAKPDKGTLFK